MAVDTTPVDAENEDAAVDVIEEDSDGLVGFIKERFYTAEDGRRFDEDRWLRAYKNYRGIYDSTTQFRESERSRVFVKITKTKVVAAHGQIMDILFANQKFPITIDPTPVPDGVAEFAHIKTPADDQENQGPQSQYGFPGDGNELKPGDTVLGGMSETLGAQDNLVEGPAKIGEPQISPAMRIAKKMEKEVHDQLVETKARSVLAHALFEMCLLGTGIVKGPFNTEKTIHRWEGQGEERTYEPLVKKSPQLEAVSCWDIYPDPSAINVEDCGYIIQRHKFNVVQLNNLKARPFFSEEAIDACIQEGPNYEERGYESTLYAEDYVNNFTDRFEVFEYWGILDKTVADKIGLTFDEDRGPIQINAWICGQETLRVVLNPFTPSYLPYYRVPYELNPYQFFGVGVPENMEDAQMIMNGHVRMAIDNLALAGNLVFDIDEATLVPGQSIDVFPGKVFRRQSGQPGQSVHGIKFPSTAGENIQMYDKARQLADEETGIPSILHGQTGVTGSGRTASGLSMLLSGANVSIKGVIKNIDDYLLKPLGEAMYRWNLQFNEDQAIVGDLEVHARGTSSVMQKEVRSQRLMALLQVAANPMLAPFFKLQNIAREIAISQDMDPDQIVNDVETAKIFAELLKGLNVQPNPGEAAAPGQSPQAMAPAQGVAGGGEGTSTQGNGGGTVGTPPMAMPGENEFTG